MEDLVKVKLIAIGFALGLLFKEIDSGRFSFKEFYYELELFFIEQKTYINYILLLFAFTFIFDSSIQSFVDNNLNFISLFVFIGGKLGQNTNFWGFVISCFIFFKLLKKDFLIRHLSFATIASGFAGIFTVIVKFLIHRERPLITSSPYHIFSFFGSEKSDMYKSFPSGDVTLVSALCLYFFLLYRGKLRSLLFLALPFLTAISRVYHHNHWPSDTVIGFFVGSVFAYIFFSLREKVTN